MSINVGRKTLYLYRLSDKEGDKPSTPLELAFQDLYGQVRTRARICMTSDFRKVVHDARVVGQRFGLATEGC